MSDASLNVYQSLYPPVQHREQFSLIKKELLQTAQDFQKRRIENIRPPLERIASQNALSLRAPPPEIVIIPPPNEPLVIPPINISFPEIDEIKKELNELEKITFRVTFFKTRLSSKDFLEYPRVFATWNISYCTEEEFYSALDKLNIEAEIHFANMHAQTLNLLHPATEEFYNQKASLIEKGSQLLNKLQSATEEIKKAHEAQKTTQLKIEKPQERQVAQETTPPHNECKIDVILPKSPPKEEKLNDVIHDMLSLKDRKITVGGCCCYAMIALFAAMLLFAAKVQTFLQQDHKILKV